VSGKSPNNSINSDGKKHPTEETVEIRLRGPRKSREAAVRAVEPLGFVDVSESRLGGPALPWRSVLPEPAPGQALKGARAKEGLTQRALADLTGLPQRHISEMETGKRPIGKQTARILAQVLKVDYRVFL